MTATHADLCDVCGHPALTHVRETGQCPGTSGPRPTTFRARRKVIDLLDRLAPRVEQAPPTLTIVHAGDRVMTAEGPAIALPFKEAEAEVIAVAIRTPADAVPLEPKPKRTRAQFCNVCGHARTLHARDGVCWVDGDSRYCPCMKFVPKKRAKKNTGQPASTHRERTPGDAAPEPAQGSGAVCVAPHPSMEQPGNGSADSAASTANDVGAAPPSLSPLSKTPAPDASSVERPESSPARGLPQEDADGLDREGRERDADPDSPRPGGLDAAPEATGEAPDRDGEVAPAPRKRARRGARAAPAGSADARPVLSGEERAAKWKAAAEAEIVARESVATRLGRLQQATEHVQLALNSFEVYLDAWFADEKRDPHVERALYNLKTAVGRASQVARA